MQSDDLSKVIAQKGATGIGLFARRPIEMNEIACSETPIFVSDTNDETASRSDLNQRQAWSLVEHILQSGRATWAPILELASEPVVEFEEEDKIIMDKFAVKFSSSIEEVLRLYAIVATNNISAEQLLFPLPLKSPGLATYIAIPNRRGIFLELSRVNHSCIPNCSLLIPFKPGPTSLIAKRAIATGEELSFSYVREGQANLLENLQRLYGFKCKCALHLSEA